MGIALNVGVANMSFLQGKPTRTGASSALTLITRLTKASHEAKAPVGAFLLRTAARTNGQSCSWRPLLVPVAGHGGLVLTRYLCPRYRLA